MRTIVRIAILAACLAALPGWAPPARAHEVAEPAVTGESLLSAQDRKTYRAAFHKAAQKRFRDARKLARKAKERLPAKVIRWMELAGDRPRGDFAEVARFLEDNPEWPRRAALLRNAELAMPAELAKPKGLPDERLHVAALGAGVQDDGERPDGIVDHNLFRQDGERIRPGMVA